MDARALALLRVALHLAIVPQRYIDAETILLRPSGRLPIAGRRLIRGLRGGCSAPVRLDSAEEEVPLPQPASPGTVANQARMEAAASKVQLWDLVRAINLTDKITPPWRCSYRGDLPDPKTLQRDFSYEYHARQKLLHAKQSNKNKNPSRAIADATEGIRAVIATARRRETRMVIHNDTIGELLSERASAYAAFREWQLSLYDFQRALQVHHAKRDKAHFGAGICYSALDRHEAALNNWRAVLKYNSTDYHKVALYWINRTETVVREEPVSKMLQSELYLIAYSRDMFRQAMEKRKNMTEAFVHLQNSIIAGESLIRKLPAELAADARNLTARLEGIATGMETYRKLHDRSFSDEYARTVAQQASEAFERSRIAGGATHLGGEDARSSATPSLPPGPINDSSPPVNSICNKFNSVVSCGANEGGGRAEESKRDRSNMLT